jgi:hypothetical protein
MPIPLTTWIAGGVAALAIAAAGVQTVRLAGEEQDFADARAEWADIRAEASRIRAKAESVDVRKKLVFNRRKTMQFSKQKQNLIGLLPTLCALIVLLPACRTLPQQLPSEPVKPAQAPKLAPEARQPKTPPECSPTCLDALTRERESWQKSLTKAGLPARPASAPTTP